MSSQSARRLSLRFLARLGALAGTAVAVSVCGTQDRLSSGGPTAPGTDATPPVVQIILPTDTLIEIADSLKFTINATDNAKLKSAHVGVTGLGSFALAVSTDTTFVVGTTAVTMYTQAFVVPLPPNAAGQRIAISASATDGSDNVFTLTDTVRVNDAQPPVVTMLAPTAGVAVGSGDTIHVLARAIDPSGIRYLGARLFVRDSVLGRIQSLAVDSLVYASRVTTRLDSFKIVVPTSLSPGSYILQAFSADSSPFYNKGASPDIAVAVRDVRPPTGTFNGPALDSQVVAGDTLPISFRASDNVGVVSVTFRGYGLRRDPLGGPAVEIRRFDSLTATLPTPRDTATITRRLVPVLAAATADSVLIEAKVKDIGGNVTTITRRIQVVTGTRAVTILSPALVDTAVSAGDSVLVQFRMQDRRGVAGVTVEGVALRGDSSLGTNQFVDRFVAKSFTLASPTDTTVRRYLNALSTGAEPVFLRVRAISTAGDTTTALRRIQVIDGPSARLTSPAQDTTFAVGNPLAVTVTGFDPDSVKAVGYVSTGAIARRDSSVYVSPLGQARTAALSLPVPGTTPLSADTIKPFVIDRLGNRTVGQAVVVRFQDLTPPALTFVSPTVDTGIAHGDSVRVQVRVRDNAFGTAVSLVGRAVTASGQPVSWFTPVSIPGLNSVDTTVARYLPAAVGTDPAGGVVYLVATATDASQGLQFKDSIRVQVTSGPFVRITDPASGTQVRLGQTGASILPLVQAYSPDTILYLGYAASGRIVKSDSVATTRAVTATTLAQQLALAVPFTTPLGTVTLTPFARTRLGRITGPAVSVELIDGSLPVVSILAPTHAGTFQVAAGDSVFVRVAASDDRQLGSLQLAGFARRPDVFPDSLGQVTVVPRFVAKTIDLTGTVRDTVVRYLNAVPTDSTAENAYIVATATDLAGNVAVDTVRVQVLAGSRVALMAPASGARVPVGTSLNVTVTGSDPRNVTYVGFMARGVVPKADSVAVSPAAASATRTLAWAVPAAAALGTDTVVPFAINGTGGRFTGTPVLISFADTVGPTVSIDTPAVAQLPVNVGDSVYVRVHVRDNRGVTQLVLTGIAHRGSVALGTDTEVTRFASRTVTMPPTADTIITRYLRAVLADSTSEVVTITGTATDSSGNSASGGATVRIVSGPVLAIVRPVLGTLTSAGKKLVVEVQAHDPNGVRLVGWRTTGVVTIPDSLFYAASGGVQPKTVSFIDTLRIPGAVGLGTFTITPFAVDSLGDPSGISAGITVTVQSAAADTTPPAVTFAVSRRIETTDSITVAATDPSGIGSLTWRATKLGDTTTVYGSGTSGALPGTSSDVRATFAMNLAGITRYPTQVVVRATATDSSGARTGIATAETLTVVAGRTFALPGGSNIGDAIYNPNRQELYLSNTALDRIEVFSLASNSFVASIPVGARPVGLALWPSDTTTRANADSLIVANSGGTNLSIVDLVSRVEKQRYRLPNYVIQKVKAQKDPATGFTRLTITEYDYSDRPMYVAAVCRNRVGGRPNCGDVIALYSTTPTPGQTGYPNRGYLAWENLTSNAVGGTKGHFFWEQAAASLVLTTDTLQVIVVRDSVPGVQVRRNILGAGVGQIVDFDLLQLQDSTFVRNSGN